MSSRYVGHFRQDRWADPWVSSRYVGQSAQRADETSPAAPGRWGRCHLRGNTCLGPVTGREREGRADWPRERDDGGPRSVTDGPASVTPYGHCRGAQARPHHRRRVRRQRAPRSGNAHGDRRGAPEPVVDLRRRRVGVGYSARRGVRGPSPLAVGRPFIVRARPVRSARLWWGGDRTSASTASPDVGHVAAHRRRTAARCRRVVLFVRVYRPHSSHS